MELHSNQCIAAILKSYESLNKDARIARVCWKTEEEREREHHETLKPYFLKKDNDGGKFKLLSDANPHFLIYAL